jgi:predicted ABC-type transport system involved in lysophospholipase L1 biosynthesis ATPase subunit
VVLKDIRKSDGAIDAIKGVDLEIKQGEFVVFVGPRAVAVDIAAHDRRLERSPAAR